MNYNAISRMINMSLGEYAENYGEEPKNGGTWADVDAYKYLASMREAKDNFNAAYAKVCDSRAEVQEAYPNCNSDTVRQI